MNVSGIDPSNRVDYGSGIVFDHVSVDEDGRFSLGGFRVREPIEVVDATIDDDLWERRAIRAIDFLSNCNRRAGRILEAIESRRMALGLWLFRLRRDLRTAMGSDR